MATSHAPRRGSAARNVAFLLLGLGVLVLVLWRLLATPPAGTESGGPAPVVQEANSGARAELAVDDPAQAVLEGERGAAARASSVPIGVRLSGPGRLDGRVIDRTTGLGVGGVRVDLLPTPPMATVFLGRMLRIAGMGGEMSSRVKPIAVAESGPNGAFHFEGVRSGAWYVDARGPYHAPEGVQRARVLASGAGGPLDVFVLGGGRVLGRVLRPDGTPAFGATVELVPGPGQFIERARIGDLTMIEQKADERGGFLFEGIPPGLGYEVTAAGAGFALTHAIDLVVRASADTNVELRTKEGGTITGRVVSAPKGEDEKGTPLAGAQLGAVPRGLRDLRCAEELLETTHCVSGPDGRFTMTHVPQGEVDLVAIAPGHLPSLGAHVAVADGANSVSPDLVLHPGAMVKGRVVDKDGAPIPGAQVRWNMVDWQNFGFDFSLAPMMAQAVKGFSFPTTDEDGRFEAGPFAGKAPFRVDVTKLGFQDGRKDWNPEKETGDLTITLHRGSSVSGVVMDGEKSEPVTSFTITTTDRVDVEQSAPGGRNPFSGGTLFEDPAGRFELASIEPGKARLVFSAPGYLDQVVDDVVVTEGQATKGLIVTMTPGGTIRGVVVDQDEKPVAGARVAAFPSGARELDNTPAAALRNERRNDRRGRPRMPMEQMMGDMPPGMTNYFASLGLLGDKAVMTDSKGLFELTGVKPGEVKVLAFHRDYASGSAPGLVLAENAPLEGVKVVMNAGGGIRGKVVDRFGRAVPSSIVVALSPTAMTGGGDPSGGALYQGQSAADGGYEMKHVQAGSYFLVATRGDEALNPASFLGNLNFDLVTVPPGEIVEYDVVDSSAGGCRVHGTLTCDGKPVARGTLTAITFESETMLGVEFKAAQVKEGGTFEFPGLAPGEYQLNLDGAGRQVRMRLEVPDAPELAIDLHCPEGGLEGVVLDASGATPLAEVDLVLRPRDVGAKPSGLLGSLIGGEGTSYRASTDKDGRFTFERLAAGEYDLVARPRGKAKNVHGPSDAAKVVIDEDRVTRGTTVKLPAALAIAGVVKDAQGKAVEGAEVFASAKDAARASMERATSDADGRFELRGLAPGVYELTANKDGYARTQSTPVELAKDSGKLSDVELKLEKGVLVIARIYGADGRPASGARAELVAKSGGNAARTADAGRVIQGLFSGEGSSDAEGRVELGRFLPGEYRLEAQRGLSKGSVPNVKVPSGTDEYEVRVELQ
ncbi:MAG: carboxypeptidase regulatory-like domain-containing protein [Planctomycetes bacterium]|nr:carboxypeptidase regulatory-like domain-containing protein [Planctomycetota bacterium]